MGPRASRSLRRRLTLVIQTQSPILATFALFAAVAFALGITPTRPLPATIDYALVGIATIASLALPFERWPPARQSMLAACDLVAAVFLALAQYDHVHAISALSAFPAVWLAIMGGRAGVVFALGGVYTAALLPLVLAPDAPAPADWASALLFAVVIPVGVVVARILVATNRHVRGMLQDAQVRELTDSQTIERLGAVLRRYADTADVGLMVFDEQERVLIMNTRARGFVRLASYDPKTGTSAHIYTDDRVTPVPAGEQPIERTLRGDTVDGEVLWVGAPGEQRAVIMTGLPLRADDGTGLGTMFVALDITGQLRRGREREDALSTLSHELRTPLNAIIGYSDLLMADELTRAAAAHVEVISRNAERLLTLSDSFLRGLQTAPESDPVDIDLGALLAEATDPRVLPGLTDRRVTTSVEGDVRVTTDRTALLAILNNLVSNAVKYSDTGDTVRISARCRGEGAAITVFNTGSHLDRHDLERVFDRFYRAEDARRGPVAGTGIGLAVSRSLASTLGGSLVADDVVDGASFTLWLPGQERCSAPASVAASTR